MWPLLRAGLHALQPETAHSVAIRSLGFVPRLFKPEQLGTKYTCMGLTFPNRIGLAAGFDKNGDHLNHLAKLGFGSIEIGTITPLPQQGSAMPRLFRLPTLNGLINRMGFNNLGVEHAARQLAQQDGIFQGILGCNIGCNRDTSEHEIINDYLICLRKLYGFADYFTINISSPNTPGLRGLQKPISLKNMLYELVNLREQLNSSHKYNAPLLVKVSPDLSDNDIKQMAAVIQDSGINGIIATNTTTVRTEEITSHPYGGQPGGISGSPLLAKADHSLAQWRKILPSEIALVGVGGIVTKNDAKNKFAAGADLVQIYTGLIYRGPTLIAECAEAAWEHEREQTAIAS